MIAIDFAQNCILYLFVVESVEHLLSRPNEEPLRNEPPPYNLTLEELAELSLSVDAESLSPPAELLLNLPYSPSFLGGGIRDLAGEALRLLLFELNESPPSDFFSLSGNLLYSPSRRGRPDRSDDLCGRGKELGKAGGFWDACAWCTPSDMRCC